MSGVQVLARLPIDQRRADAASGMRTAGFITGYPGSPLAGYDVELGRHTAALDALGIVHQPAVNEELAATAVAGSQLAALQPGRTVDGVSALWYAKAPGLDRAGDAIRHGNLMGAGRSGGVLVCVGDDPQAKSSSVPSTSEPTLFGLGLPVLAPADPQEMLELGLHGFALSRASGLWASVRIPASVADAVQRVDVGLGGLARTLPEVTVDGRPFVHRQSAHLLGATLIELEKSLYGPRLEVARRYAAVNGLDRVVGGGSDDVLGIVASGPAYLSVRHALGRLGVDERGLASAGVRILKVALVYPLDTEMVRRFAAGLREVVVVEDKRGFLELLVKEALYGVTGAPRVVGKVDEQGHTLIPATGEVDPDALVGTLAGRLLAQRDLPGVRRAAADVHAHLRSDPPLSVARGAYFCAGCPHNTGVTVPPGAVVGSGSGCHGLAIRMDPRVVGDVVGRFQMGGEGAMWNGMAPFVSGHHFFQNLGDGTFAHSGVLSIRASVAAGVDITYKLLVNSVVAMTGGQTIVGGRSLADLARLLLAEGVARIIVTTDDVKRPAYEALPDGVEVWERHRILAAQEALASVPGVTVLMHDQACALEKRRRSDPSARRRARRVFVNPLACDGCGECGATSNCVSVRPVRSAHGSRTEIHQESCNLDYSCLDAHCPAMVTVEPPTAREQRAPVIDLSALPRPPHSERHRDFSVRITGVGGTGVVTAARIIARAARRSGLEVRGVDQTGIAQRGGSVASDLRIGEGAVVNTHRLGAGECDLYLGCDLLVAAEPRHVVAASPTRTLAVMSTCSAPTGNEVADRSIVPPDAPELRARIERRVQPGGVVWVDAQGISRRRFGSEVFTQVLLLGVACQRGALPLDPADVEDAIRAHGVDPDANVQAFRFGRLIVADPALAAGATRAMHPTPRRSAAHARLVRLVGAARGSGLEQVVESAVADLTRYQDRAYARRYAQTVARCREAEETRCAMPDGPFARTVAVQLHRVMAYRDEYEVARLHRSAEFHDDVAATFGAGATVRYHLHPPLLERAGFTGTLTLGHGADAVFGSLASLRHLRATPVDPFGHSALRRLERELRDNYIEVLTALCASLSPEGHARAVAVAALPEDVRGYGAVKEAAIERFRSRLVSLVGPDAWERRGA